jgi:hypothetical protein
LRCTVFCRLNKQNFIFIYLSIIVNLLTIIIFPAPPLIHLITSFFTTIVSFGLVLIYLFYAPCPKNWIKFTLILSATLPGVPIFLGPYLMQSPFDLKLTIISLKTIAVICHLAFLWHIKQNEISI